ncbi:MAG: GNAT family N-acetyltransferase [Pyrinomonadaceae bacterium]
MNDNFPFADLGLARRLERSEALGNVDFVEARARAFPESKAEWLQLAGAYAMFDGPTSPVTQTFGLGMEQPLTAPNLNLMEEFFTSRGARIFHEVCPLADPTVVSLLNERGYEPIEFTSVLYRPIGKHFRLEADVNENIHIRLIEPQEHDVWADVAATGWSEFGELADFLLELGRVNAKREHALCYFAELNGHLIATGVLNIFEGVALLAGASTIPEGRKQGAQLALLQHRLRHAAEQGCDIAMMGALPGSASQRNAERHGFRIAYTRVKWQSQHP